VNIVNIRPHRIRPITSTSSDISARLSGLDIARAIAVVAMFVQHFYSSPGGARGLQLDEPASWTNLANNNSTVLFALLAGISKSLIDGGMHPHSGSRGLQSRTNIIARALLLFAVSGLLVTFVQTPGSVLGYIAAGFIVTIPFLRVRPGRLLVCGAIGAVLLPYPMHVLTEVIYAHTDKVSADSSLDLLLTGLCPALIFLPVFMIGVALGRCNLRSPRVIALIGGVGVTLTTVSYLASWLLTEAFGPLQYTSASSLGTFVLPDWRAEYNVLSPHINGVLQMTVGIGIALTVIAASLAVAANRSLEQLLYPIRALGMCAFTAYIVQFATVVIVFGTDSGNYAPTNGFFSLLTIALIAGCTGWLLIFRRGPFEWVLNTWATYISAVPAHNPPTDANEHADLPTQADERAPRTDL
jgi:uncharacterized protein